MTPTNRCLDGETLAAWVDGGLSRNDAAMAEAHVSSCPRCQEIAGLIMKILGGLILWGFIAVIFFRWGAREAQGWDALQLRDVEAEIRAGVRR